MLRKLIAISLDHAALVLVLAGLLVAFAAYQAPRMPVDVFPELNAPTVVILTEAKGLAADEVERFVTFPIESAVSGVPGVRRVRSGSAMSLSLVYVEFDWGTDIDTARVRVGERLAIAEDELPGGVHAEIAPSTGITGEIMMIAVSSPDGSASPLELRSFAEFDLRQRLLAVAGVAQVVAIGGELPEYQVHVRQDALRLYGLTMSDVVDAAGAAHSTASAGYLANVAGVELSITQSARVRSAQDIRDTVVRHHEGSAVTIGQVADVAMGPTPARGTASSAGQPAVVLSIKKSPGTNTLDITRAIDAALDQAEAGLPRGIAIDRRVLRQADFIRLSIRNVVHVLRDAAIFVAVVLVLFLLSVRTTIITLVAIPLSLAMALLFMSGLGLTVNVMTLGGLAIAIGELVDDAIIDVENIHRRLRENRLLPEAMRKPDLRVIYEASNEVRSSVVFATVIIVIVFVPLLFLQGVEGRFFQPMGVAYITSILASLLVALTVVPAMCRYLLRGRLGGEHKEGFLVRLLKAAYEPSLRLALRVRGLVLALAGLATVGALLLASTFGSDFLPDFNEGTFTIFIDAPPGTSLAESDRMTRGLDRQLAGVEGVRSVVRRTGRAERDEHAHGVNRSEIQVSLVEGADKSEVLHRIDDVLANMPGLNTEVGAPIGHQLSHVLSGTQAAIAINVFGGDLATLRQIAEDVERAITPIPGVRDVLANREAAIESLAVRYRHEDLRRWGLTPAGAAEQVEAALSGVEVDRVNEGLRQHSVVVRLHPDERGSVDAVRGLLLRGAGGALVRLSEVADIHPERTPLGIARENGQRKSVVSLNVAEGHNLGHVVDAVQRAVDPIVHSYGYAVSYGGQFEAQQSAARTIYVMGAFVLLVVLVLLSVALGSWRAAALVMVNLPLALIGGVVAIFLTESPSLFGNLLGLLGVGTYQAPVISIASMVGFVTLFGIAVRNGILLVNHYAHLLHAEGAGFDEAVVRGSMERLVPILMTALTAVLGLVPLALASGEPGSELLAPLAIVVLGGLVTSTLLNLVVVPAGYHLMFRNRPIPAPPTLD